VIWRLRGQLAEKDMEGVLVDVGGVGYRASASATTLRALPGVGEDCVLHTRMVVREDAMALYGFADKGERAAFDALTAVSKIGPKLALAVLSKMSPNEVAEAVGRGDVIKLSTVPGLGRKTAERLVLELRGKSLAVFEPTLGGTAHAGGPFVEAREALTALGYSIEEAEGALKDVPPQDSVQKYVREALKRMRGTRR
jgi:Holliday junction DNA helicase RuvA